VSWGPMTLTPSRFPSRSSTTRCRSSMRIFRLTFTTRTKTQRAAGRHDECLHGHDSAGRFHRKSSLPARRSVDELYNADYGEDFFITTTRADAASGTDARSMVWPSSRTTKPLWLVISSPTTRPPEIASPGHRARILDATFNPGSARMISSVASR